MAFPVRGALTKAAVVFWPLFALKACPSVRRRPHRHAALETRHVLGLGFRQELAPLDGSPLTHARSPNLREEVSDDPDNNAERAE